jgi:low affinity Fe/Cu permease
MNGHQDSSTRAALVAVVWILIAFTTFIAIMQGRDTRNLQHRADELEHRVKMAELNINGIQHATIPVKEEH